MSSEHPLDERELRNEAARRLKRKRDFAMFLGIWLVVSIILTVVWWLSGGGYFWPIWAIFGMGIAAMFQFIDIFVRRPITSDDVDREVERLKRRGVS